MLVSYRWLKETVGFLFDDTDELAKQAKRVADDLTSLGLEVVRIQSVNDLPKGLVIGYVEKKQKHPNADKLNLVDIRYLKNGIEDTVEVVCGAQNIRSRPTYSLRPSRSRTPGKF